MTSIHELNDAMHHAKHQLWVATHGGEYHRADELRHEIRVLRRLINERKPQCFQLNSVPSQ